jgi:hypothetical protein
MTASSALHCPRARHGEFVDVPVPDQSAVRAWIV